MGLSAGSLSVSAGGGADKAGAALSISAGVTSAETKTGGNVIIAAGAGAEGGSLHLSRGVTTADADLLASSAHGVPGGGVKIQAMGAGSVSMVGGVAHCHVVETLSLRVGSAPLQTVGVLKLHLRTQLQIAATCNFHQALQQHRSLLAGTGAASINSGSPSVLAGSSSSDTGGTISLVAGAGVESVGVGADATLAAGDGESGGALRSRLARRPCRMAVRHSCSAAEVVVCQAALYEWSLQQAGLVRLATQPSRLGQL